MAMMSSSPSSNGNPSSPINLAQFSTYKQEPNAMEPTISVHHNVASNMYVNPISSSSSCTNSLSNMINGMVGPVASPPKKDSKNKKGAEPTTKKKKTRYEKFILIV